jgi:hypothetical protein
MTVVESASPNKASGAEIGLWSVLVVVAGAVPALGLAVGIVVAVTRLRENHVARILVPLLGAAATVLWALGLWGGAWDDAGVGPVERG